VSPKIEPSQIKIPEDLGNIGKQLADNPKDAGILRSIQKQCKNLQYEDPGTDIRFLAFFLSQFIDDFFYNLTGDIPYSDELLVIRNRCVQMIGQKLQALGDDLQGKQPNAYCSFSRDLVVSYLAFILEAKKTFAPVAPTTGDEIP